MISVLSAKTENNNKNKKQIGLKRQDLSVIKKMMNYFKKRI